MRQLLNAPPLRVVIVEETANPTTDYFVLPAVESMGVSFTRCRFADLPVEAHLVGALVIFVRYVPSAWKSLITKMRDRLSGVVFFMDDDVLDISSSSGMPWRYRYKLATLSAFRRSWLAAQQAELWVSTPYLLKKYASWRPRLVLPLPLKKHGDFTRVFYHGSASHSAEIRWLHAVMAKVLESDERITFEIVGGADVYESYRKLPRVTVINPMKWAAYQSFLLLAGRHIGLVPQLDIPFNRARSYTKFFDITRAGAVGIYARESACAEMIEHGVNGLLCPMEQDAWVTTLLDLANNKALQAGLLAGALRNTTADTSNDFNAIEAVI